MVYFFKEVVDVKLKSEENTFFLHSYTGLDMIFMWSFSLNSKSFRGSRLFLLTLHTLKFEE